MKWFPLLLLLLGGAAAAQVFQTNGLVLPKSTVVITPQVIQHWATSPSSSSAGHPTGNAFQMHIQPTLAGDVLVVGITGWNGQTVTITDSAGDTSPTAVCSADAGATHNGLSLIYAFAPTTGTSWVKATWSGSGVVEFDFFITEFNNVSAADQGHNCQAAVSSAANVVTPTGFTPTNNDSTGGNLIVNYTPISVGDNTVSCNASSYTPASGFSLLSGNVAGYLNGSPYNFPTSVQMEVQTTHASTVASVTMPGENCSSGDGDPFNTLTIALKVGASGTALPSTIRVVKAVQVTTDNNGASGLPTTFVLPTPWLGNLRVWMFEAINGNGSWAVATSVTSSDSCNYTSVVGANTGMYLWYAENCSPCPTCTTTFHLHNGTTLANTAGKFYDIVNANASSYQNYTDNSPTCSTGSSANNPSFTPGNSAGVSIAMVAVGNGPETGATSPSGLVYAVPNFTGQDDGESLAFGDAHGFYYYSSNAAQNWTWTISGPGSTCSGMAAAFK